jgi:type I restriction enzyme M protein
MEKLEESVDFHDLDVCGQLGDIYDQALDDLRSAGSD